MAAHEGKLGELLARSAGDPQFREELLTDARAALEKHGARIPGELIVKALADSEKVLHLVLPARPTRLSDLELDKIAVGTGLGDWLADLYVAPRITWFD